MLKDPKTFLVPKLRFPEFRNEPPWVTRKLGELFRQREETGRDDLRLLSLTDKEGIIPQEESNRKNNASVDRSKYLRVARGDIVYNTMRMWEGRSALATLEGIVSPAYTVCEPCEETNSLFFAHYFKTSQLVAQFARYSQGLVKDTLNLKFEAFARILAPTPSPAEQQKIAECLSTLDELIEAESRKLDALKDHKKGLMQQLFPREGETRPRLRFPEFRSSGDWKPGKLGNEIQLISGTHLKPDQYGIVGEVPYFSGPSDFTNDVGGVTKWTNRSTSMAFPNNILITVKGSGVGELWFSTLPAVALGRQLMAIRSKGASIQFIYQLLLTKKAQFQRLGAGNLIPGLSRSDILEMQVYFPKKSEQKRIASCLSSLDEVIEEQGKKLEALRTHKRGLMQQLFPNPSEFES